jgi:FAD/FMN-containing dehydrogenase/Fe-S oxidoreductase
MTSALARRTHLPVIADRAHAIEQARGAHALETALRDVVRGEVRFDAGSRALYANDASNYRQIPIGVVVPEDADDVIATVEICRRFEAPIVSRGGGTGLAGQTNNVAVLMDHSKRNRRLLSLDPERRIARVQPGLVLDHLRDAAKKHQLTFGPDPATHEWCTLGGMMGNDSCGVHALMAGKTSDNVESLDVLLYDGTRMRVGATSDDEYERIQRSGGRPAEIYRRLRALRDRYADEIRARFAPIPRRVSGYNLDRLLPENGFHVARALVGSESTCVTILDAELRLVPRPRAHVLAVLGYEDVFHAADAVPDVLRYRPVGLEGIDELLVRFMRVQHLHVKDLDLLPEGRGFLLVEMGADTREEAASNAKRMIRELFGAHDRRTTLYTDPQHIQAIWEIRESGLGATAHVPGHRPTWPGWEDSAVAPEKLGGYIREFRELLDRYGYEASLYGHFGQGCLHCSIDFDLFTAKGIDEFSRFVHEAAHLCARYGGSFSGEHGDGHARGSLLPIQFGESIAEAFREFKRIWDPDRKMNPRQAAANAPPPTVDLRFGTTYAPAIPATHFAFPDDRGSLAEATQRCVGVGKCRREDTGTMCPSYQVTREEMHSTRGRAHLLNEMLRGDVVDGWRDEHVKEALDLCLSCKGCKHECPVGVDVATYKAEFLAHHYSHRFRPASAYAMGFIDVWARLAEPMPWLANVFIGDSAIGRLARSIVGLAPERAAPRFASHTFRHWWRAHKAKRTSGGIRVVLWPDTFNNHFHPDVAIAAVLALEELGYAVDIPRARVCCGRPLYDFGFLDRAKRLLTHVLDVLREDIRAGTPIVGLEPSCLAVLKDELVSFFPADYDARRLSQQVVMLGDLLVEHPPARSLPRLERAAIVHGHCHHKAVLGFEREVHALRSIGLDLDVLDAGCCGLAGAFGYEKRHYAVAQAAGERVLLPAVRAASAETLIVSDGFSCRSQIEHSTDRRAMHVAHVLKMAFDTPRGGAPQPRSEQHAFTDR